MDPGAREAFERARRERALAEIRARVEALESAGARPGVAGHAAMRLRRLLTTLRDDVPPELLARAKRALGE